MNCIDKVEGGGEGEEKGRDVILMENSVLVDGSRCNTRLRCMPSIIIEIYVSSIAYPQAVLLLLERRKRRRGGRKERESVKTLSTSPPPTRLSSPLDFDYMDTVVYSLTSAVDMLNRVKYVWCMDYK